MILPISIISVAACLLWSYYQGDRRSPLTVGLIVWAVAILLPAVPLLTFSVDYSLKADLLIGTSLVVLSAGYMLVRSPAGPVPADLVSSPRRELRLARILLLVGVAGGVLLMASGAPRGVGLSALSDLSAIRGEVFDRLYSGASSTPAERFGALLAPAGIVAIIAVARYGQRAGRRLLLGSVAMIILFTLVGVLVYAGRSIPFYTALLAGLAFYLRGGTVFRVSRGRMAVGVIACVAIISFSVPFISARQVNFNAENTLAAIARAQYHPLIEDLARSNPQLGAALVSETYFGSTVPTLSYYLEQGSAPGPMYGQYSFPLVYQMRDIATGSPNSWIDIRREVFGPLEGGGYYGNVWPTWLRDLVVDFGYVGALVFCFLFGGFMGWTRNRSTAQGGLAIASLEAISCLVFAFGAFTNLMPFQFIAVAFAIALGLYGARQFGARQFAAPAAQPGATGGEELVRRVTRSPRVTPRR